MIWLLGLVITAIAATAGLMLGAPSGWMVVVALAGLLAWDLNSLHRRLSLAAPGDGVAAIRSRHLIWLGLTAVAGLLLTAGAMLIPLHFSLAWIAVLAFVAILGMAQLVAWLHHD